MDIDADPEALARDAQRLTEAAARLAAAAHRLAAVPAGARSPGGLAERCAALCAGLRADAAELFESADRLRSYRADLLLTESAAVSSARALPDRAWWER